MQGYFWGIKQVIKFENMKTKQIIFWMILSFFTFQIKAQNSIEASLEIEKNSISGNIFGTSSVIGVTYERIMSKKIIFEAGVGYIGLGAGVSYYPFDVQLSKFCPYLGAKFSTFVPEGVIIGYIPFGLTLFSKNKVNIGIDIGPSYGKLVDYDSGGFEISGSMHFFLLGNLKIGMRF